MRLYAVVVPPPDAVELLLKTVRPDPGDKFLAWHSPMAIRVGLCYFGNLTQVDCTSLAAILAESAREIEPFGISFKGGTALDGDGDEAVWARLDGDLDSLRTVARNFAELGRHERYLVDRRWYRPQVELARINDATTAPRLQETVDRLEAYQGPLWDVSTVELIEPHTKSLANQSRLFDRFQSLQLGQ